MVDVEQLAAVVQELVSVLQVQARDLERLVAHIERFKRYPAQARGRGEQGVARVAFTIDRDGWVRESRIIETSGSAELDRECLAMLVRAQPMPKPPSQAQTSELSFVVPVRFNIK